MKKIIPAIVSLAILATACNINQAQVTQAPAARAVPRTPAPPPAPAPPGEPQLDLDAQLDAADLQLSAVREQLGKTIGRTVTAGTALVIPKDSADPKALADAEEDMNVMAHILEKAVSTRDERNARAMGIVIHQPFGSSTMRQNLYLEGYGALFFLNVNYPLVPPPAAKKQEPEAKEETNSEWEDARRELYRPPERAFQFNSSRLDWTGPGMMALPGAPAEEYDAEKVETLKKDLINALKNAVHIRKLKSDEAVTVVVSGRAPGPQTKPIPTKSKTDKSTKTVVVRPNPERRATKLILRAKKSDLESFEKDKLSLEEFRKKITIMLLEI
jgi:hypothetical protein